MIIRNYLKILILLSVLFIISCNKNKSLLESHPISNLIKNSSFEENGQPSLKYWYIQDSSKIKFSNDTPADGGKWSIYLHAEWYGPLPKSPSYFVTLSPGRHILEFSVYGKSKTIHGSSLLVLKKGDHRQIVAQNRITDSIWTKYSLIDTLYPG